MRVGWKGEVACVASGAGFAGDPAKLAWQQQTKTDDKLRFQFAAEIIRKKLIASIDTLEGHLPPSRARDIAMSKASLGMDKLVVGSFADMNDIFAIEGECASAYFAAWHGLELQWKGLSRRPIPKYWGPYSGRSSIATGVRAMNRNASHPINAMLNYAYGVKLAAMQLQAIADGYDPTFGIMHSSKRRGSPAFVLDLIEPERPRVDVAVLKLVAEQSFAPADFIIRPIGSCRLSPQLARAVASLVLQL